MTEEPQAERRQPPHWLVDLATVSGVENAELPAEPGPGHLSRMWEVIAQASEISESELTTRIASHFHLQVAELSRSDGHAVRLIPVEVALGYELFPMAASDIEILVATADPRNRDAEQEVRELSGRTVRFELAAPSQIADAIARFYSPNKFIENVVNNLADDVRSDGLRVVRKDENRGELEMEMEDPAVVRLTKLILDQLSMESSDEIQIEALPDGGRVRVRHGADLRHFMHLPAAALQRVVYRLKKLAGLHLALSGKAQRGSLRVEEEGVERELFVAATPGLNGENLTILQDAPDYEYFVEHMATTVELARAAPTLGTIVVVDDDESSRRLITAVLEKRGFEVLEAEDGPPALELLNRRGDVSLVVLDLNMPQMHGSEVLQKIRGSLGTAGLPVVVLTSIEDPSVEVALLEAGADDYLRKPIDPERLAVRVQAVLRRAGSYEAWPDPEAQP